MVAQTPGLHTIPHKGYGQCVGRLCIDIEREVNRSTAKASWISPTQEDANRFVAKMLQRNQRVVEADLVWVERKHRAGRVLSRARQGDTCVLSVSPGFDVRS